MTEFLSEDKRLMDLDIQGKMNMHLACSEAWISSMALAFVKTGRFTRTDEVDKTILIWLKSA